MNRARSLQVLSEIVTGMVLCFIVFNTIIKSGNSLGQSYFSGIFFIYGLISLTFFIPVLIIGIISAKRTGKSHFIKRAIFLSIGFWLISLIIYTLSFSFFSYTLNWDILPILILQIGIVLGFNVGIYSKSKR
jgi:predicted neutral ceramidase superfamily lipid hydrolase